MSPPIIASNSAVPRQTPSQGSHPNGRPKNRESKPLDENKIPLFRAATEWSKPSGSSKDLEALHNVVMATQTSGMKEWKEVMRGNKDATLENLTAVLKGFFDDAKDKGCKQMMLVADNTQILLKKDSGGYLKRKSAGVKLYRGADLFNNTVSVERHAKIGDRLTLSVINALYGDDVAQRFLPSVHASHTSAAGGNEHEELQSEITATANAGTNAAEQTYIFDAKHDADDDADLLVSSNGINSSLSSQEILNKQTVLADVHEDPTYEPFRRTAEAGRVNQDNPVGDADAPSELEIDYNESPSGTQEIDSRNQGQDESAYATVNREMKTNRRNRPLPIFPSEITSVKERVTAANDSVPSPSSLVDDKQCPEAGLEKGAMVSKLQVGNGGESPKSKEEFDRQQAGIVAYMDIAVAERTDLKAAIENCCKFESSGAMTLCINELDEVLADRAALAEEVKLYLRDYIDKATDFYDKKTSDFDWEHLWPKQTQLAAWIGNRTLAKNVLSRFDGKSPRELAAFIWNSCKSIKRDQGEVKEIVNVYKQRHLDAPTERSKQALASASRALDSRTALLGRMNDYMELDDANEAELEKSDALPTPDAEREAIQIHKTDPALQSMQMKLFGEILQLESIETLTQQLQSPVQAPTKPPRSPELIDEGEQSVAGGFDVGPVLIPLDHALFRVVEGTEHKFDVTLENSAHLSSTETRVNSGGGAEVNEWFRKNKLIEAFATENKSELDKLQAILNKARVPDGVKRTKQSDQMTKLFEKELVHRTILAERAEEYIPLAKLSDDKFGELLKMGDSAARKKALRAIDPDGSLLRSRDELVEEIRKLQLVEEAQSSKLPSLTLVRPQDSSDVFDIEDIPETGPSTPV